MYVGRLLVAAPGIAAYRVSSRSFPNRRVVAREGGTLTVAPTPDAPPTENPYVSYNCVRRASDGGTSGTGGGNANGTGNGRAVVGNGSHVDPVAEKVDLGYPPRDALATALLALDFEKDDYDTPRIAAVVDADAAVVGVVRRDALVVETVDEPTLVATYERNRPEPFDALDLEDRSAEEAARAAYDLSFEHPVCAAAVRVTDGVEGDDPGAAVETGLYNGPDADG
jgi:IMP cyclohydrolase